MRSCNTPPCGPNRQSSATARATAQTTAWVTMREFTMISTKRLMAVGCSDVFGEISRLQLIADTLKLVVNKTSLLISHKRVGEMFFDEIL